MMKDTEKEARLHEQLVKANSDYARAARRLPKDVVAGRMSKATAIGLVDAKVKDIKRIRKELRMPPPATKMLSEIVLNDAKGLL